MPRCTHEENIDPTTHIGICKLCGQERQYDRYNLKPPVIIKRGRVPEPETKVPAAETIPEQVIEQQVIEEESRMSRESTESVLKPANWPEMAPKQKKKWYDEHRQEIIINLANIGSFETRRRWGLPMSTLNSLLKRWEEPPLRREKFYGTRRPLSYWEENREKLIADYNSMTLRDFLKAWRLSTSVWTRVRDQLEIEKKSQVSELTRPPKQETKGPAVSKKVQELLPITMPTFPAFNDKWFAEVQIEWFKTYLELKKI